MVRLVYSFNDHDAVDRHDHDDFDGHYNASTTRAISHARTASTTAAVQQGMLQWEWRCLDDHEAPDDCGKASGTMTAGLAW